VDVHSGQIEGLGGFDLGCKIQGNKKAPRGDLYNFRKI